MADLRTQAFTEVSNQLVEFFKFVGDNVDPKTPFESKEEYCQEALAVIESELEAVGSVTASAYTEALATVEITGNEFRVG